MVAGPPLAHSSGAGVHRAPTPQTRPHRPAGGLLRFLAFPYLFLIDYSAPRFFLPAYAPLAPPIATLIAGTQRDSGQRAASFARLPGRSATATAIGLLFLAHLASQVGVLTQTTAQAAALSGRYRQAASTLRRLGVHPPCLVSGPHSQPVGYNLGCASGDLQGNNHSLTPNELRRRAAREPTAVLTTSISAPPPALADRKSVV